MRPGAYGGSPLVLQCIPDAGPVLVRICCRAVHRLGVFPVVKALPHAKSVHRSGKREEEMALLLVDARRAAGNTQSSDGSISERPRICTCREGSTATGPDVSFPQLADKPLLACSSQRSHQSASPGDTWAKKSINAVAPLPLPTKLSGASAYAIDREGRASPGADLDASGIIAPTPTPASTLGGSSGGDIPLSNLISMIPGFQSMPSEQQLQILSQLQVLQAQQQGRSFPGSTSSASSSLGGGQISLPGSLGGGMSLSGINLEGLIYSTAQAAALAASMATAITSQMHQKTGGVMPAGIPGMAVPSFFDYNSQQMQQQQGSLGNPGDQAYGKGLSAHGNAGCLDAVACHPPGLC